MRALRSGLFAGILGTIFVVGSGTPAAAQLGHVVGAQKISDTSGGFTALLEEQDQFGRSIVNLGDLDGDGTTDLLVGAHTDDDGPTAGLDRGSVYVLFLHPNGFVKAWQKISALSGNFSGYLDPGDQFGRAAANLGDLDGDGVVDVAVSSNYDDDGGTNKGAIYILFLNTDGTVKTVQKISSTQGGLPANLSIHDEFGRSITSLGDLDGDGVTDIVVGTPEDDDGGTNTGALHVLFLNTDGTVKGYHRISRSSEGLRLRPGDWFGHCSADLGDFDHDGVTDLVVGSVLDDDGGFNQGSIWILLLRTDGSVKASFEINELYGGFSDPLDDVDQFGTSVTSLGDLDGDGVTDIAVGAVKDDDGGEPGDPDADVGAVYVLFLNADATVKSQVKISDVPGSLPYGLDPGDWFGSALVRLGGSPNDGLFNVAIGCRYDNDGGGNHGGIYLAQLNDGSAPVSEFTASRTLGVAPLTVAFTDLSAGEVTAWLWDFSAGPVSTLQHPSKTFGAPGTYGIELTTRGPTGRDVLRKHGYITVSAGPLAGFEAAPTSGAAPLSVHFTDLSEGAVTSWSWDFGDGTGASERHPQHVYAAPGTYDVRLGVTGPSGADARTRAGLVVVEDLVPAAQIELSSGSGFAPLSARFTDGSSGAVTSWLWEFGDGATSGEPDPGHVFSLPGSYTVRLAVSGPHGSDVATALVEVRDPVPAALFEAAPGAGFAPLAVRFTDGSSGDVTAWSWDFGDGSSSSESEPEHVYEAAGTYSVALTVSGPAGADSLQRTDLVAVAEPPPVPAFTLDLSAGFAPFTASFTDQSFGLVTSWLWDFGDGTTSTEASPVHVFVAPGTYAVSLTVDGPHGSGTVAEPDLIHVEDPLAVAGFDAAPAAGIAPLSVQFADRSGGALSSWLWEFGDGSTSTERDPEHVYAEAGSYSVRLTVAGTGGTHSALRGDWIQVVAQPPAADFFSTPSSGFAPLAVQFTDLSSGPATSWLWDFGDGQTSSERDPEHVYASPGSYGVRLTVSGPEGADDELGPDLIQVLCPPPVPEFAFGPALGFAPLPVAFTDLSTGSITSWSWSFGDGGRSRLRHPVKVYQRPGVYTVVLTVEGPGGTRTVTHGGLEVAPLPSFPDGGFESQTSGAAPASPWSVTGGTALRIEPTSVPADGGLPSDGTRWCAIGADGTSAALPPSNPLGAGELPLGTAGIEQEFPFSPLAPHLLFDAVFVLAEPEDSAATNDFMSVDLSDGTSTWNVFHADTFSEFPETSAEDGLPRTALERVRVDLRELFPAATPATRITLRVGVGNAGDGARPSRGLVDGFRLAPAALASFRNGTGRNAPRYHSSPAVLGGDWTVVVDASGHARARTITLSGWSRPVAGIQRSTGEVLANGLRTFSQSWPSGALVTQRTFSLPPDPALAGQVMATQVTISGGVAELTNAYDLILGF